MRQLPQARGNIRVAKGALNPSHKILPLIVIFQTFERNAREKMQELE
jgi:hypothetical protein